MSVIFFRLSRLNNLLSDRPFISNLLVSPVSLLPPVRSGKTHRSNDGVTAMVGNEVLNGARRRYVEVVTTDEM